MKKSRVYLLLALVAVTAFVLGITVDSFIAKSYADGRKTDAFVPNGDAFEVTSTGSTSSANYEIVNIYGRKYIIFSSGGDIEVLNY